MEQKICLDTDVVIAILNGESRAVDLVDKIKDQEVYISTVTLFELLLRETNLEQIEVFRNKVRILNFDELSSRRASLIFKYLKKKGKIIDFRDLFIASICSTTNCRLATFNKRHFVNIDELKLI